MNLEVAPLPPETDNLAQGFATTCPNSGYNTTWKMLEPKESCNWKICIEENKTGMSDILWQMYRESMDKGRKGRNWI